MFLNFLVPYYKVRQVYHYITTYSDKKTGTVIKSTAFLFSAAIWPHLAHS